MQLNELLTKHPTIKTILQELVKIENRQITHCPTCPGDCQGLANQVLSKWEEMSNPSEWEDIVEDPDFSWTAYCEELQEQLLFLRQEYPSTQPVLNPLIQDLAQVESQGEGHDLE